MSEDQDDLKNARRDCKEKFFADFSDEAIRHLCQALINDFRFVRKVDIQSKKTFQTFSKKSGESLKQTFPFSVLWSFLNLFSENLYFEDYSQEAFKRNTQKAREILAETGFASEKIDRDPKDTNLLYNKHVGAVALTRHAWERYAQRVLHLQPDDPLPGSGDTILSELRQSFERAKQYTMSAKRAFYRFISNECVPVTYLYDPKLQIRFIVCQKEPRALLTVEGLGPREKYRHKNRNKKKTKQPQRNPSWYERYLTHKNPQTQP